MAGTRHTTKAPRKRSCTPKVRFETHGAAERFRQARIRQGAAEWSVNVYRCRFCGFRHVGHRPAMKYVARARR